MKKIIAFVLALCLLIIPVSAERDCLRYAEDSIRLFYSDSSSAEPIKQRAVTEALYSKYKGAMDSVVQGLMSRSESIYLGNYKITPSVLSEIIDWVMSSQAEIFDLNIIGNALQYSYSYYSNGNVAALIPQYAPGSTVADYNKKLNEYRRIKNRIVKSVPKGLSKLGKIMYVHDYLVSQKTYDTTYSHFDAYYMAKYHTGVCQAYTLLFSDILDDLGIWSTYASSDNQVHIWNIVELDGEYYHIDLTWDDAISDKRNYVFHDYFLLSTEEMLEKAIEEREIDGVKYFIDRSDWKSPEYAGFYPDSTLYDSLGENAGEYVWHGYDKQFAFIDGGIYKMSVSTDYNIPTTIDAVSSDFKSITSKIAELPSETWSAGGNSYYIGYFSGFSVSGNCIYGNTTNSVWKVQIKGGRLVNDARSDGIADKVCTYTIPDHGYICDSFIDGFGRILFFCGKNVNNVSDMLYSYMPIIENSDSSWAGSLIRARDYLFGKKGDYNYMSFDVNGDLVVDVKDMVRMKQYAAGIE